MKAAWYTQNGEAQDVMLVGELPTPSPQAGEVLVRLACSGVNPSDVKSRRARPLTDPLVVPHSDGAGVIEAVGEGVLVSRVGQRVWVWNGQWQRALGTWVADGGVTEILSESAKVKEVGIASVLGGASGRAGRYRTRPLRRASLTGLLLLLRGRLGGVHDGS